MAIQETETVMVTREMATATQGMATATQGMATATQRGLFRPAKRS